MMMVMMIIKMMRKERNLQKRALLRSCGKILKISHCDCEDEPSDDDDDDYKDEPGDDDANDSADVVIIEIIVATVQLTVCSAWWHCTGHCTLYSVHCPLRLTVQFQLNY